MTAKKKTQATKKNAPLIVEPYPKDYSGYPFITLIQYRKQHMLTIIDNADDNVIKAYVLDMCGPESVDEEQVISIATEWYRDYRTQFPISIAFSRVGLTNLTSKIYRSFNTDFISRIIGPVSKFPMSEVKSVKRRRRKAVPPGVEINHLGNRLHLTSEKK